MLQRVLSSRGRDSIDAIALHAASDNVERMMKKVAGRMGFDRDPGHVADAAAKKDKDKAMKALTRNLAKCSHANPIIAADYLVNYVSCLCPAYSFSIQYCFCCALLAAHSNCGVDSRGGVSFRYFLGDIVIAVADVTQLEVCTPGNKCRTAPNIFAAEPSPFFFEEGSRVLLTQQQPSECNGRSPPFPPPPPPPGPAPTVPTCLRTLCMSNI